MWKLKATVIAGVLVGAAIFGATVAHGAWWWNAQFEVEDVDVRTIWMVNDDEDGAENYHADIIVKLPKNVDTVIDYQTTNHETISFQYVKKLKCTSSGIQAKVKIKVTPLAGADGSSATLNVTSDGQLVGTKTRPVNRWFTKSVLLPTNGQVC